MSKYCLKRLPQILQALVELEDQNVIKGLGSEKRRMSLAMQIVESYRRVEYVKVISKRDISLARRDPSNKLFDPLKAAVSFQRSGEIDESFWMVFFFVHFGKNARGGWRYAREVYNALGQRDRWSWKNTSSDKKGFRSWLAGNVNHIKSSKEPGGFGNHRKYVSLDAYAKDQTGAAFETYIDWIGPTKSHLARFKEITSTYAGDQGKRFDALYESMNAVKSFGRMARFDYLCMIGKLGLFDIMPNSVYIASATGPKAGGKLLFAGSNKANRSNSQLEADYTKLERQLNLPFGMQILEDAVCNWQKSPDEFRPFRG